MLRVIVNLVIMGNHFGKLQIPPDVKPLILRLSLVWLELDEACNKLHLIQAQMLTYESMFLLNRIISCRLMAKMLLMKL